MDFYKKPEEKKTTWSWKGDSKGSYSRDWGSWWKDKKSTRKKYSSRLGFSSSYYSSDYYGGYTAKDSKRTEKSEALRKAYENSRDLVNILDFPFVLNIYFNNHDEEKENTIIGVKEGSRKIYVRTDIVDDTSKTEKEIVDVISGAALHEASHLMFTSINSTTKIFGTPQRFSAKSIVKVNYETGLLYDKLKKFLCSSEVSNCCQLGYKLFSFIEDERVDTELLEERNGFVNYVESNKSYLYDKVASNLENAMNSSVKTNYIKFFLSLIQFIRFPEKVDSESIFIKSNPKLYSKVSYILEKYKPTSTLGSCIQAVKFLDLLLLVIKNNSNLEKLNDILSDDPEEGDLDITIDGKDFKSCINSIVNSLKSSSINYEIERINNNDIDIRNILEDIDSTVVYGKDEDLSDKSKLMAGKTGASEIESLVARGIYNVVKDTYFIKVGGDESDKASYLSRMESIKSMIPSMRNLVRNTNKNYDFVIPSQRTGKLDTTKLVEAYQGVPHVYNKMGRVNTSGAHICVVIDESGSMDWDYRIREARKAAILMNEAFGNIPGIELYIYGHTADDIYGENTTIHVYREPGFKTIYPGVGLNQVSAQRENRDGQAYRDIANRVRSFTSQPVIMFVLSDGDPSACGYRGDDAIKDTIQAIKEVESKGFHMIQVIISDEDIDDDLINSFKSHINVTKYIDKLPSMLAGETRKILLKILQDNQSTVTY